MRYIRTKDKIIQVSDEYVVINGEAGLNFGGKLLETIYGVIAQANTIEELCDYVFCKDCFGELQIKKMWGGKMQIQSLLLDRVSDVKLAILTDKGLIYVAKMKGVLPNGEIDWELL